VAKPRYKRILLKISGEALQGPESAGIHFPTLASFVREVAQVHALGVQIGLVVGGGNIFRGIEGAETGLDRATGDYMGMLATVINALAVRAAFEKRKVPASVLTAIPMGPVAEAYDRLTALRYLEEGRVVIFGGGTGNPFFTTDTAAALRASEIGAGVLMKATKVDGVYTADPMKDKKARKYERLTYTEVLSKNLRVMDAAAVSLCRDSGIPILVFNLTKPGSIIKALRGKAIGTLVESV